MAGCHNENCPSKQIYKYIGWLYFLLAGLLAGWLAGGNNIIKRPNWDGFQVQSYTVFITMARKYDLRWAWFSNFHLHNRTLRATAAVLQLQLRLGSASWSQCPADFFLYHITYAFWGLKTYRQSVAWYKIDNLNSFWIRRAKETPCLMVTIVPEEEVFHNHLTASP